MSKVSGRSSEPLNALIELFETIIGHHARHAELTDVWSYHKSLNAYHAFVWQYFDECSNKSTELLGLIGDVARLSKAEGFEEFADHIKQGEKTFIGLAHSAPKSVPGKLHRLVLIDDGNDVGPDPYLSREDEDYLWRKIERQNILITRANEYLATLRRLAALIAGAATLSKNGSVKRKARIDCDAANERAEELAEKLGAAFFKMSWNAQALAIGCHPKTWKKTKLFLGWQARVEASLCRDDEAIESETEFAGVESRTPIDARTKEQQRSEVLDRLRSGTAKPKTRSTSDVGA